MRSRLILKEKKLLTVFLAAIMILSQTGMQTTAGYNDALVQAAALQADNSSYTSDDVAVINAIIRNSKLAAMEGKPENWDFVRWSDSNPKKIVKLDLSEIGLTGSLDVSSLDSLTWFKCTGNQLTALNVSGLSSLAKLSCSKNKLTTLNLSGLSSLNWLDCYENQLTALERTDISLKCGIRRE